MGRTFKRDRIWHIAFNVRGKEIRESAYSEKESDADKLLKKRIQESGRRQKFIGPKEDKVTFENLCKLIRDSYITKKRLSTRRLDASIKRLGETFAMASAINIDSARIKAYAKGRLDDKAKPATINRELSALKRMFKLALQYEILGHAPYIEMLTEDNVRQGFLEYADFLALKSELPERLRDPVEFLYLTGWRSGEMTGLLWSNIRTASHDIYLPPKDSIKRKKGRVVPLVDPVTTAPNKLGHLIARAEKNHRLDCPFVFHRDGKRIKDF
jgi:integrase